MRINNPVIRNASVGPAATDFPTFIYIQPGNEAIGPLGTYITLGQFNADNYSQFSGHPFGTYLMIQKIHLRGGAADAVIQERVNLNGSGGIILLDYLQYTVPAGTDYYRSGQIIVPLYGTIFPYIGWQFESSQTDCDIVGDGTIASGSSFYQLIELGTNDA